MKAADAPPESPTTARPLDFDDDALESGAPISTPMNQTPSVPKPPPKDEAPPAKPPRPLSPREQAELTLREAFPSIDASIIKAVLIASGSQVEPAFNALLSMSDPDSQREPPAKPPRPVQQPTSTAQSQLEADEMYARQLHEHLSSTAVPSQPQRRSSKYNEDLKGSRVGRPGANPNPDNVPWRSFIDDDLPEIRDNIKKGFLDTQSTVNKWLGNLKKKIDGDDTESDFTSQPARPAQGYSTGQGSFGRRSGDMARRSADMQRYDADPQVIGDDFSRLEMRDGELPERRSSRPLANPNLFRPTAVTRTDSQGSGRKVSFQDGPPEEIKDMYSASSYTSTRQGTSANKSSKWQPLSVVEPSPIAENDPFSLGDSDDDKDAKPITLKDDEEDRLQNATAGATSESMGADTKK
jgi:hypothetical protein